MASLTETAYHTRKAINWFILFIVFYFILRISWGIILSIWLTFFPPEPPPPNHLFNQIPKIVFPPPIASPSGELTYRLETIEGYVPHASPSGSVFFIKKAAANYLSLSSATDFAKRLEFKQDPQEESKTQYVFVDALYPLRYLKYDIVTKNFLLRYAYERDTGLFAERSLPLADAARREASTFLSTYGLEKDELTTQTSVITPLKLSGTTLETSIGVAEADAVRVDIFRPPIDGVPVVTSYPDEGQISFVFSGSKNIKKRILQVSYSWTAIDMENSATYPLKSSNDAWMELQNGQGYIARYPKNSLQAIIRNVYIGYYDSIYPQTYLQPVFVFEGDNGFLAYVSAVSPEWIQGAVLPTVPATSTQ